MDQVSILVLALLMMTGGAIGYSADVLGRRIGKKRHSIGRMRPKHFAAFSVTVAGALLPLATFGILYAVSEDVRIWLRDGRAAVVQLQRSRSDLSRMRLAVQEENRKVRDIELQRQDAIGELGKLREEGKRLNLQARALRTQVAGLRTEVAAANTRLRNANESVKRSEAQYRTLTTKYQEVSLQYSQLSKSSETLKQTNTQFVKQNAELGRQTITLAMERGKLEGDNTDLKQRNQDLKSQLDAANSQFEASLATFRTEIGTAQKELDDRRKELDSAQIAIDKLQRMRAVLEAGLDVNLQVTRSRPLIFGVSEEVARSELPAGVSTPELQQSIDGLMRSARVEAQRRGARPKSGSVLAASLVDLPLDTGVVTVNEQISRVQRSLNQLGDASVLIVYSLWNSFAGEFVPLRLEVFANPVVFAQGEIVAESRINGAASDEEVLKEIDELLSGGVRAKARSKKMVPTGGTAEQYGTISSSEVLSLMRNVRSAGRRVRVVAVAAAETRAAGPLRLDFRIR